MNRKKVFVVIAVLLAALISTSFMVAAQAEGETSTSLYVQNAESGFFIPLQGEEDLYILTLKDVSAWTIHITDTPEYASTKLHTRTFVDTVDFSPEPLSAVVELLGGHEEADLITVRLTEPLYDSEEKILKYKAEIISHDYAPEYAKRHAGEDLIARVDEGIPETFGFVIVYIHSEEPVEEVVSMSVSTQRFSPGTAVIGLSVPETFGQAVAYQAVASTSSKKFYNTQLASTPSKKYSSRRHFHAGIKDVAEIEGTLVVSKSDAYLDVEIKLIGMTVKSYRLDARHPSYCVSLLLVKACATANFNSFDPPRGNLTFKGCYISWGKWKCQSIKVISWS